MSGKFKKTKGNMYNKYGEEFAEEVLRKNVKHPAPNNPAESAQR